MLQYGAEAMEDLAKIELVVGGRPVATLAEMQTYAYAVPEDQVAPAILTRFIAGEVVEPGELYRALIGDARASVASDPAGLEIINMVAERLRKAFPAETT